MMSALQTTVITVVPEAAIGPPREMSMAVTIETTVKEVTTRMMDELGISSQTHCKFALSLLNQKGYLPENDTILKYQQTKFLLIRTLFDIVIFIEETEKEEEFYLAPTMTVREAIAFVEACDLRGAKYIPNEIISDFRAVKHELLLITSTINTKARGLRLDFNRTLGSYRLSPKDTLILTTDMQVGGNMWKFLEKDDEDDKEIPVIISSPEFELVKTFRFKQSTTFQTVLEKFIRKSRQASLPYFYALYLDIPGVYSDECMDSEATLGSFPLPIPARLKCRYRKRPAVATFGTDPSTLPMVEDQGFEVPEVLMILRKMFELTDGINQEGIFRKAGNEKEMRRMILLLDAGYPVVCSNPHSIASLLKRWFKCLPRRLLTTVDKEIVDDPKVVEIDKMLPPLESRLTKWLLELLYEVVQRSEVNKMTPANLGIVFGPGMLGSETEVNAGAMSALSEIDNCRIGKDAIERHIVHIIEHPDRRPLLRANTKRASPLKQGNSFVKNFSTNSKLGDTLVKRQHRAESEHKLENDIIIQQNDTDNATTSSTCSITITTTPDNNNNNISNNNGTSTNNNHNNNNNNNHASNEIDKKNLRLNMEPVSEEMRQCIDQVPTRKSPRGVLAGIKSPRKKSSAAPKPPKPLKLNSAAKKERRRSIFGYFMNDSKTNENATVNSPARASIHLGAPTSTTTTAAANASDHHQGPVANLDLQRELQQRFTSGKPNLKSVHGNNNDKNNGSSKPISSSADTEHSTTAVRRRHRLRDKISVRHSHSDSTPPDPTSPRRTTLSTQPSKLSKDDSTTCLNTTELKRQQYAKTKGLLRSSDSKLNDLIIQESHNDLTLNPHSTPRENDSFFKRSFRKLNVL